MEKKMILVSGNNDFLFYLIPITTNCPFVEGKYDKKRKILVLISKYTRDFLEDKPRENNLGERMYVLDEEGNKKIYITEKVIMREFYESYISNKEDILFFLNECVKNVTDIIKKQL